jgi:hypothetical protein
MTISKELRLAFEDYMTYFNSGKCSEMDGTLCNAWRAIIELNDENCLHKVCKCRKSRLLDVITEIDKLALKHPDMLVSDILHTKE